MDNDLLWIRKIIISYDKLSEDIDIYIHPPADMGVEENPKKEKPNHIESRQKYFDWLAGEIKIDGHRYCLLPAWIHLGRKAANHCKKVPQGAGNE